jgi:hypothetical protein
MTSPEPPTWEEVISLTDQIKRILVIQVEMQKDTVAAVCALSDVILRSKLANIKELQTLKAASLACVDQKFQELIDVLNSDWSEDA